MRHITCYFECQVAIFVDPVRLPQRDTLEVWFFFRTFVPHFGKKEGKRCLMDWKGSEWTITPLRPTHLSPLYPWLCGPLWGLNKTFKFLPKIICFPDVSYAWDLQATIRILNMNSLHQPLWCFGGWMKNILKILAYSWFCKKIVPITTLVILKNDRIYIFMLCSIRMPSCPLYCV